MMKNLLCLLLAGLIAVAAPVNPAAAPNGAEIRIGWTAWSDAEAITRIAARILERRLDYEVELVLLDIALQYNAVARGDLDLMLMAWLPNTHADYWARTKDDVEDLGVLYSGAKLGWVVPDYVPADTLGSLADLKKPAVRTRLHGRINGIDPGAGLMRLSQQAIDAYGLDGYNLIASSGAGMTAALTRAVRRERWIVATAWRPHWIFGAFDLRFLTDPKGALGGEEGIHAVGRKGLSKDHPRVAGFVSRLHLPLDRLEALMYEAEKTSYEDAAAAFIRDNPKLVEYWVTGRR